MMIRTKILLSHGVMAVMVTLICVVIVEALRRAERNQYHLQSSYEQIRIINLVAARANEYSEQVAEIFIVGEADGGVEVVRAREALSNELERMRALIEEQLGFERTALDLQEELAERDRLDDMVALLRDLDAVQMRVRDLLAAGEREEAVRLYVTQIEHRLDSGLSELIEAAMASERAEVARAIAVSERLWQRSTMLAAAVVLTVLLVGFGNAWVLNRTISRPIAALAAGADAVGRGDLGHVVGHSAGDELGHLAARFDLMTEQVRHHRGRLMQAQETLAQQVDDRTRQLRERGDELEAANTRLRELDANRAQFFADISHELRTPVTIIRGQAEVALRGPADDQRRTLELVVRKAEQIGRLVDDLLFLARSEAGTISVAREPVVLQNVIADVLLDSQSLSRRDGITISPRQPAEPVAVCGDAERLRQVVLIALDNAIKFAPTGSRVSVDVRTEAGRAVIAVHDDGPGFSEEERTAAFWRFYRGRASRGRSGRGTGLGLSIARWIMERHDGTIEIVSDPDEGATIEIGLPMAEAQAA